MRYLFSLFALCVTTTAFAGNPSYVSAVPVTAQSASAPISGEPKQQEVVKKKYAPIDPMYVRYISKDNVLYSYDVRSPKDTLRPSSETDDEGVLEATTKNVRERINAQQRMDRVGSFPEPLLKLPSMPGSFGPKTLPQFPAGMNKQIRSTQPVEQQPFVSPFAK